MEDQRSGLSISLSPSLLIKIQFGAELVVGGGKGDAVRAAFRAAWPLAKVRQREGAGGAVRVEAEAL